MKSKFKEGWFPKWVQNAYKAGFWFHNGDFGARRPNPTKDPAETNHERVVKQREARKKQLADEKALKELKEKS